MLLQLSLYDVRRMSSAASSVVNFGGLRGSQQLVAAFNVPARADEAAAAAAAAIDEGGSSQFTPASAVAAAAAAAGVGSMSAAAAAPGSGSSSSACRFYPFFRDVAVNPADANLVAYVRPDLQVTLGTQGFRAGEQGWGPRDGRQAWVRGLGCVAGNRSVLAPSSYRPPCLLLLIELGARRAAAFHTALLPAATGWCLLLLLLRAAGGAV